jgi:serine/threonine-protein kinase
MERLEGADLGEEYKRRGRLPIQEAVGYVLEVSEAVAEAHALGIIHRDLKPGNLFLARRRDGSICIKVLDFGISKLVAMEPGAVQQTTSNVALGSPLYMSPEQMISARDVDVRTDIWALGVILYQLVTGELPFRGETLLQLCSRVVEGPPPEPPHMHRPEVPAEVDAAIMRCLQKDRELRFASVAELATALVPFAEEEVARPTRRWLAAMASGQPAAKATQGLAEVKHAKRGLLRGVVMGASVGAILGVGILAIVLRDRVVPPIAEGPAQVQEAPATKPAAVLSTSMPASPPPSASASGGGSASASPAAAPWGGRPPQRPAATGSARSEDLFRGPRK